MQQLQLKAAIAVAAGVLFGTSAQAQSLSGIKVGEEISSASEIDARPLPSRSMDPHEDRRWKLPDGNRLSIAADPETKKIVYTEKTWGGGAHGKPTEESPDRHRQPVGTCRGRRRPALGGAAPRRCRATNTPGTDRVG
jgi:hypothetical protein